MSNQTRCVIKRTTTSSSSPSSSLSASSSSSSISNKNNIKSSPRNMTTNTGRQGVQFTQQLPMARAKRIKSTTNVMTNNNNDEVQDQNVQHEQTAATKWTGPSTLSARLNHKEFEQQQHQDTPKGSPSISLKQHKLHQIQTLAEFNTNASGCSSRLHEGSRFACSKDMPWFGMDVGGSLVKVVFFDPKEASGQELVTLKRIRRYLKSARPYGKTGKLDTHLEMSNCLINKRVGSLHFIRFATSEMPEFLAMAKTKQFAETVSTICATGGGACKFEHDIRTNLGIKLHKTDELDSIIYGINYIDKYNSQRECYFLEEPLNEEKCVKIPYDFSRPYPYLVVNIGSGVSILAVYSATSYSRICGSSIGGGTFLGLCCMLTQCETFEEAIQLATAGSSTKIDKSVKDIYGGDYSKFGLSGDTVASNFGNMNLFDKRKLARREDLARASLEMVTNNIGALARLCSKNEGIDRVVFIGNFLRVNPLSMKLLSNAVNYWSKGATKALFLEHEGYFGAVGCFVESTQTCCCNHRSST